MSKAAYFSQAKLRKLLTELVRPDEGYVPINDSKSPPWVEPGVVTEVSAHYYERQLEDTQSTFQVKGLPTLHLCGKEGGRASLAWMEHGQHFVLEIAGTTAQSLAAQKPRPQFTVFIRALISLGWRTCVVALREQPGLGLARAPSLKSAGDPTSSN